MTVADAPDLLSNEEWATLSSEERFKAALETALAWQGVARRVGVCMSCALNSVEPCTDCLGTGWNGGSPAGYVEIGALDRAEELAADLAVKLAPAERERDELRTYAHEATKAITGVAGGGSELFAGKIGEMYKADLPFCVRRVRERDERAHGVACRAIEKQRRAEAALVAAQEAMRERLPDEAMLNDPEWRAAIDRIGADRLFGSAEPATAMIPQIVAIVRETLAKSAPGLKEPARNAICTSIRLKLRSLSLSTAKPEGE